MSKPTTTSGRRASTAPAGTKKPAATTSTYRGPTAPAGLNRPVAATPTYRGPTAPAGMNRPAAAPPARRGAPAPAGTNRPAAAPPARRAAPAPADTNRPAEAAPVYQAPAAPFGRLKTNRGLLKIILLSIITLGIYNFAVMYSLPRDINIVAFRYDGRKTMDYCLLWLLCSIVGALTLGFGLIIGLVIWRHRISARIGRELRRRRVPYSFGATDYWLWNVLGAFIIVGPFIYTHKLMKAMNKLCEHYNENG